MLLAKLSQGVELVEILTVKGAFHFDIPVGSLAWWLLVGSDPGAHTMLRSHPPCAVFEKGSLTGLGFTD